MRLGAPRRENLVAALMMDRFYTVFYNHDCLLPANSPFFI